MGTDSFLWWPRQYPWSDGRAGHPREPVRGPGRAGPLRGVGRPGREQLRPPARALPGFGRPPRGGRSSKLSANQVLLARFIDDVIGGPAVLVGNSMGGAIAMLQAAYEPASAEAVVLSASVFPWARGGVPSALVLTGFALYRAPGIGEWVARKRLTGMSAERIVRLGLRHRGHRHNPRAHR